MDINPNLMPDVVGDVRDINKHFHPGEFDLIVCCEVLEHLPFEHFENIIRDFSSISSNHVYLTLPRAQKILLNMSFTLKIPFIKRQEWDLHIAVPSSQTGVEHFWELDSSSQTRRKTITEILSRYYNIERFEREIQNPYHNHIILSRLQK